MNPKDIFCFEAIVPFVQDFKARWVCYNYEYKKHVMIFRLLYFIRLQNDYQMGNVEAQSACAPKMEMV